MELVREACEKFLQENIVSIKALDGGNINDTYLVEAETSKYICQRVRKKMNVEVLEHNYRLYADACGCANWSYPVWIKTSDDRYFYTDMSGDHWRMYPYLVGTILEQPLSKEQLFECGVGLAKMHAILQTLTEKPKAVYPEHHDLKAYYARYLKVLESDAPKADQRDSRIEARIDADMQRFLALKLDKTRVIHGDPKLANILFQDGKVWAFIDYDTVMQGSLLEDLADCIRSCCMSEGKVDLEAMGFIADGYRSYPAKLLTDEEYDLLPDVIQKLCFELGLRYYTDHLAKEKAFREKYPGYLLEKARRLFA